MLKMKTKLSILLIATLVGIIVLGVLGYILSRSGEKEARITLSVRGKVQKENKEAIMQQQVKQKAPSSAPAKSEAGWVGEVTIKNESSGAQKPLVTPIMPSVIFSTAGKIIKVKTGSLLIKGDGSSFVDGIPRYLKCIFTDDTLTFTKDWLKYKGKDGLSALQQGMNVLIESADNIRGKTEFTIKTVNILE